MTDRIKGFQVVLDRDYRDDDVKSIILAIRMIKGVKNVTPVVSVAEDTIVQMRVTSEIKDKLYDFIANL